MKELKADLHIHTLLSPCGSLEMSPGNIIRQAVRMGLDIIGITDHNSTRHCHLMAQLGALNGITVLMGAEVTTREEVHCLAFFENEDQLETFQGFLDTNLPDIANEVDRFGYQVVVDADENIIFQEERLLTSALLRGIDEVEAMVHELEGLFIPAHIDKSRNSIFSQLGFLPPALRVDAIEVSPFCNQEKFRAGHSELAGYPIISGSDAHHLNQLGTRVTYIESERADFNTIRKLFHGKWQGKIKVLN